MAADNTIFDDVFRTMLEKMPGLIIPVINEVFHTSYSKNEEIIQYRNEHHTQSGEIVTDSYFRISDKLYHLECQSTPDSTMSIRMIEYDFAIALEDTVKTNGMYEMNFPHSCVLFLRHNNNTPDYLRIKVNLPDGTDFIYQVPAVRVQEYTRDDIFKKKLLFFLPFYIMRYEKQLDKIGKDPLMLRQLLSEYEGIRRQLKEELSEDEETELYTRLTELIKKISDYILNPDTELKERIGDIMGGKVLELETDRILERGIKQGIKQGIEQGIEQTTRKMIERMLAEDEPLEKITMYTGCTMEDILQIQDYLENEVPEHSADISHNTLRRKPVR